MKSLSILTFLFFCSVFFLNGQSQNSNWRDSYFSGNPLQIGNKVQFLFDDYLVEDKYGLKRIIGPVEKYSASPLTVGIDMPWELNSDSWGGANLRHVIYDPEDKLLDGNEIEINFRSHVQNPPPVMGSMIRAELLQPSQEHHSAQPYPGFSMQDCDPVIINESFNHTITFNGKSDLSSLKGKPVYIRFYIINSTLYTLKIINL